MRSRMTPCRTKLDVGTKKDCVAAVVVAEVIGEDSTLAEDLLQVSEVAPKEALP